MIFSNIGRVLLYAIICYGILLLAAMPFVPIALNENANNLILILVKESSFFVAGIIVILISMKYYKDSLIIYKPFFGLVYYFCTVILICVFCFGLYIFNIIEISVFKITDFRLFVNFLIFCLIPTLFTGFGEELIFRWFLLNRLRAFLNLYTAVIIGSIIFCFGHNWNLPNILFAFSGACLFSIVYIRTNSILNCIGIHSAWNFGQRFLFQGMSDFSYESQRFLLLRINDLDKYNWAEFLYFAVLLLLVLVYLYFNQNTKSVMQILTPDLKN